MDVTTSTNAAPGFVKFPDYAIVLEKAGQECVATLQGRVIAKSNRAIILKESNHMPVVYFPLDDIERDTVSPSDKETFCPFKGTASYWSFGNEKNIAWSYEDPFDEMLDIKDYVAFYSDRLDAPILA
ncbi:DUF427 domain-containing protein [Sneathiella marina]|uniref:DUF427 domain-containing protein n=1 Tax=Sneathiella marina TaxID=2950108 RepID=A0ABY4W806_9PROT|nr:DUF427 domain-containing protein [Sneathiella marina]USG63157.1 DUF427 domain-containing protein [Sneathiella marina]